MIPLATRSAELLVARSTPSKMHRPGRTAALMANHGAITHAADLATAVQLALLLEWACTIYWRAATIGTPRSLDADAQAAVVAAAAKRGYGSTRPIDPDKEAESP